jgi:hypothetical protein
MIEQKALNYIELLFGIADLHPPLILSGQQISVVSCNHLTAALHFKYYSNCKTSVSKLLFYELKISINDVHHTPYLQAINREPLATDDAVHTHHLRPAAITVCPVHRNKRKNQKACSRTRLMRSV